MVIKIGAALCETLCEICFEVVFGTFFFFLGILFDFFVSVGFVSARVIEMIGKYLSLIFDALRITSQEGEER